MSAAPLMGNLALLHFEIEKLWLPLRSDQYSHWFEFQIQQNDVSPNTFPVTISQL